MTASDNPSMADVHISDHDGILVAVLTGEIDIDSVDAVGTVLFDRMDTRPEGLVIDVAVTFMGSAGLSMLLELHGRSQRDGVGFAVVTSECPAMRPLLASGLNKVLPLAKSVEDAVESIRQELVR